MHETLSVLHAFTDDHRTSPSPNMAGTHSRPEESRDLATQIEAAETTLRNCKQETASRIDAVNEVLRDKEGLAHMHAQIALIGSYQGDGVSRRHREPQRAC